MESEKLLATIQKLRKIRTKEDLKAPPSKILKTTLDNGGSLTLRQYQIQGILHLLAMPRFVLGTTRVMERPARRSLLFLVG